MNNPIVNYRFFKNVFLIFIVTFFTSCNNYKEIKNENLKTAFTINSSPTFKGYYYKGSDNNYHYFVSKWSFEKDRYFKLAIADLILNNSYRFDFGKSNLKIDVFEENNKEFAHNEFCKLYIASEIK